MQLLINILFLICVATASCSSSAQLHPEATQKADTISVAYYPGNKVREVILNRNEMPCQKQVLRYYEDGGLKEKGCQGYYENDQVSTGIPVGKWEHYDDGKLTKEVLYHNDKPETAFIETTTYYSSGMKKSVERYNNYELYETEPKAIGEWKYYDEQGQLIKTINQP